MNPCTIKRGIFTLRECGNAASDVCTTCGAALCQEHATYSLGKVFCAKCQGDPVDSTDTTRSLSDSTTTGQPSYDRPGWSQNWRDDYYRGSHYVPFLYGWGHGRYDDADRNGFAKGTGGDAMNDNDQAAGFSDS